jgi:hypothetical protein
MNKTRNRTLYGFISLVCLALSFFISIWGLVHYGAIVYPFAALSITATFFFGLRASGVQRFW